MKARDGDNLQRIPLRANTTAQGLILTTLALMAVGVVMVYSISGVRADEAAWYERTYIRQAIFAAVAMTILCFLWRMDYRRLAVVPAAVIFVLAMGAAAAVFIPGVGHGVGGDLRWILLGPIGFQPSEVLKIALLIILAAMLGREDAPLKSFRRAFIPAVVLIGVSLALVVTEDFGTAVIIGVTSSVVLLVGGVCWYYLAGLVPFGVGAFYMFVVCVPHRWARIDALINPDNTANPATYQPRQAVIAIGSGVEPAGLGAGLAKYGYLPEGQTDFIFANICNELGMLGAFLVIGLLLVWLVLACRVAVRASDRFGALLAGGLGFLIVFQAVLHIAVNVRLAPPTGVSLPFVSAGGSSLLLMSAATALIVSVSSRKRMFND
jgi:cell division protein FtsW